MNWACIHPAPLVAWQSLEDGFCAFCLGRALDKTEQCSRWDLRPFSEQQLKYAALDAWILLALLGHIIKKAWNSLKEECDIVWLIWLLSYFLKFDEFCNLSLHLFRVWTVHFFNSWHSSFQSTVLHSALKTLLGNDWNTMHIVTVGILLAHFSHAIGQDAPLELEELARFSVSDALKTLAWDIMLHHCCTLFFEKRFGLRHLQCPRLARRGCAGLDRGQNGQVWFWFAPMLL